jgi:hypothetical protein
MPRKLSEIVQVNLRMRESLRRRIEKAAVDANNSLNAEMVERLDRSFQNEDLRPQLEHLNQILIAFTAKQAREGRVIAGWLSDELRKRGLEEANTKDLIDVIRAYFGPPGLEKETTQKRVRDYATGRERRQALGRAAGNE